MTSRSSLDDHNVHDLSLAPLGVLELLVEGIDRFTDGSVLLVQGVLRPGRQVRFTFFQVDRIEAGHPCTVVLSFGQGAHMLMLSDLEDSEVGGAVGPVTVVMVVDVNAVRCTQGCDDCDIGFGGGVEHDRIFPD